MHEFELIKKYFSKLSHKSKSSLNLNDDVFLIKKIKLLFLLTLTLKVNILLILNIQI